MIEIALDISFRIYLHGTLHDRDVSVRKYGPAMIQSVWRGITVVRPSPQQAHFSPLAIVCLRMGSARFRGVVCEGTRDGFDRPAS